MSDSYLLRPIGTVHSGLRDPDAAPMQGYEGAPAARIHIEPPFRPALDRLAAGQEVIVLSWLHRASRDTLAVHPRDDPDIPLTGVFATRSPDRPNPVGLHRVRVLTVEDGWLDVEPLEAIDGTPVIDIKPVLGRSDDA